MFKRLIRKIMPNPFKRQLAVARNKGQKSFLILWNRGMGDIALGLYGLCSRIRDYIPDAKITFITRPDLEQPMKLLNDVEVIVDPAMIRGECYIIDQRLDQSQYDIIILKPDPTYWLSDQLGKIVPKLEWNFALDQLEREEKTVCVGMHVSTETGQFYGYDKNWPKVKWKELIGKLTQELGVEVILFGLKSDNDFDMCNVTDLRGELSLIETLSVIKNRCTHLVAPDSGILSLIYFIDANFPLKIISLWSDPKQGVLKAGVKSPNRLLEHIPLVFEDLKELSVNEVLDHIEPALDPALVN
ncbi:MAG: glycosyltransferase family 9 protein [Rhabdochlamydiaceae bacterium]|nr:glycosyltransferase family 9 protein [Candidatus Amphrikana amoebophyrae]